MLIHLVKKDILISKKYAQLVILMAIGIPLFIGWRMPEFAQYTGFALAVVFSEFMFFKNLSMKENQYSKASALLCSTPYPSRGLVQSKYIVFILIFVYCVLIYWIESLFIPRVGSMNLTGVLAVFFGASVVYSIYVPLQYKLGYDKTKIFFMLVIMASPVSLAAFAKYGNLRPDFLDMIPVLLQNVLLFLAGTAVLLISMKISVHIYRHKELI